MIVFVVVGRLGKSLTISKATPFLASGRVSKVYIFRQEKGFPLNNAQYVTLPGWILTGKPSWLFRMVRFVYEPLQLYRYCRKYKPDLINGVFILPKGLNSTLVGKLTRTRSIVSVIGGVVEITTRLPFQPFWKSLNLHLLRSCDAVTTKGTKVSAFLQDQGICKEKIFILNGSIDTTHFFYDSKIKKDIDVLFAGNFRKLKGPDRVLKVVSTLIQDGTVKKSVFLGTGVLYEKVKEKIETQHLQDYVSLKGYKDDPAPYFKRAKSILIPSTSEGLPMVMVEAMACGCVPIVSDVGNISDAAFHEINAFVIERWDDIKGFTSAAKRLLSDEILWKRLSENARKTVAQNYTPAKQAEVVNQIFTYLEGQ